MVYKLLKPLVVSCTKNFFRQVQIRGATVESGPLIIVANHPNVVLDAVLIMSAYHRELWFTVKGEIFRRGWLNGMLRWLHCLPVYRRQDDPRLMHKNEETFRYVTERLRRGSAILLFPEGESVALRRLEPFKTGAARMALQAECETDFTLGITIQPVGITYADFFRFNSTVTLTLGRPIDVRAYRTQFIGDPERTVRALTEEVKRAIQGLTVEVHHLEETSLIEMADQLYRSRAGYEDDLARLKMVTEKIERLHSSDPGRVEELKRRIALHLQLSEALKLSGGEKLDTPESKLFIILMMPFVLIGIATLLIPYKLSFWVSKHMSTRMSHYASWVVSAAFILFPIWALLIAMVIYLVTSSMTTAAIAVLSLIACGYCTSKYFSKFAIYIYSMLWPGGQTPVEVLRKMRDELIFEIEELARGDRLDMYRREI